MICKATQYTLRQLLTAIFVTMLLVSCDGGSSSNSIDDADVECSGSSEVIIDGQNVCPDDE